MNDSLLHYQLRSIFLNKWTVVVTSVLCACVLAIILKDYIPAELLGIWLVAVIVTNIGRLYLGISYRRNILKSKDATKLNKHLVKYRVTTLLCALSWGLVSIITMKHAPDELDGIIVAFVLSMAAGGSISNVADKLTAIAFALLLIVPFMVRTLYIGSDHCLMFFLAQFVFLGVLGTVINRFNSGLLKNAKLSMEKKKFLEELEEKFALQQELKEEKLKSFNSSKFASIGEMAAGIGHEINNPLTIVMGHHWKLQKKLESANASSEVLEELESAKLATVRIGNIVKSMRQLSRVNMHEDFESFDTDKIVETVMPLLFKSLQEKDTEVVLPISSFSVEGHLSQYAQIFYNIMDNAIAALEFSEEKTVRIECHEHGDYVELSVANCGEEIEKNVQDRMFHPFFTTREIGKGTGLGLSLAKKMIEQNCGEVIYTHEQGWNIFTMRMLKVQ
ncbi:MAG: HAMP domain-containing histidine kinase [Bacteriovoracaceae bacterium]|nr:HAMP domain-containing histidine kinase [Bacteriovoracaceae bacterium]